MQPQTLKIAMIRILWVGCFLAGGIACLWLDSGPFVGVMDHAPVVTVLGKAGLGLPCGFAFLGLAGMACLNRDAQRWQMRLWRVVIIAFFMIPVSVIATQLYLPHHLSVHGYRHCPMSRMDRWQDWTRGDDAICPDVIFDKEHGTHYTQ